LTCINGFTKERPVPPSQARRDVTAGTPSADYVLNALNRLWSGSSTTNPISSMQQTISEFATVLTKALAEAKVIA
jgi:hypothetical protein